MAASWPSYIVKVKSGGTKYADIRRSGTTGSRGSGVTRYRHTGYWGIVKLGNDQYIVPLYAREHRYGPFGALKSSGGTPVTYEEHLENVYKENMKVAGTDEPQKPPIYYYDGKPYVWDGKSYAYGTSNYLGIDKREYTWDPTAAGAKYYFGDGRSARVYPNDFQKKSSGSKDVHLQRYGATSSSTSTEVFQDNDVSQLDIDSDRRLESGRTAARIAMDAIADGGNQRKLSGQSRQEWFSNQSVKTAAENALRAKGYSDAMIAWYFNPSTNFPTSQVFTGPSGNNTGTNSGGSGGGGQSSPPRTQIAPTPAVTRVTIRAPFGYAAPPEKAPDVRPQLVQNYTDYERDNGVESGYRARKKQSVFYFPYVPSQVQYSGLGSEWVEIPRQGNFPIVEWSNWNLLKVQMEFLIAEDRQENGGATVPDGIFNSVSRRIQTLREMAQRQAAVSVFNLDDMFRVQLLRAKQTGKPMQFVISGLEITALRRSQNSIEKEITAAQVNLTLQEIPIEEVTLVKMSPPEFSEDPPKRKKDNDDTEPSNPLYTDTFDFFW